eukprot:773446-Rhodomonas_salina.1
MPFSYYDGSLVPGLPPRPPPGVAPHCQALDCNALHASGVDSEMSSSESSAVLPDRIRMGHGFGKRNALLGG